MTTSKCQINAEKSTGKKQIYFRNGGQRVNLKQRPSGNVPKAFVAISSMTIG
jgi:hypothetical protein